MKRPLQTPLQERYTALQPSPGGIRGPNERVMLVSSRSAVWEPLPAPMVPVDPVAEIMDPIWDHRAGSRWTPDLVHCRFVDTLNTLQRLPGRAKFNFRTLLGQIADCEPDPDYVPLTPPTPAQITLADWTWREVIGLNDEARWIVVGMAAELGVRAIARKMLKQGIADVTKSTVARRYIDERRRLAAHWQTRRAEPCAMIDASTFNRWRSLFENARK